MPIVKKLNRHLAQVSEELKEDVAGAQEIAAQLLPLVHNVNQQSPDSP